MEDVRIIEVKRSAFADNDADAERLRRQLQQLQKKSRKRQNCSQG